MDDDQDGGWVSVSSDTGSPGQSRRTKGHKTVVMVALWNRADHIYFHAVVCTFFLLFFPRLISAAAD